MRSIVDIYEKLSIDDVKIGSFADEFPTDEDADTVCDYLKSHGFKEIPWPTTTNFAEFEKDVEKENKRVFTRYEDVLVRFADTSRGNKISEKNPIFVVEPRSSTVISLYLEFNRWWEKGVKYNDFMNNLIKVFDR